MDVIGMTTCRRRSSPVKRRCVTRRWRSSPTTTAASTAHCPGAIIANLLQNAATAQKTIAEAVGRLSGARTCGCKDALATAIITQPQFVPEQTKKDLAPIIGKYMK
jgi:hypothetical protein